MKSKSSLLTTSAFGFAFAASALFQPLQAVSGPSSEDTIYLQGGITDGAIDEGWFTDRHEPIAFEAVEFDGRDTIAITVGPATANYNRTDAATFRDTQGRKIEILDASDDYPAFGGADDRVIIKVDFYLDSAFAEQPGYGALWASYINEAGEIVWYETFSFTSFVDTESELSPRFRVWESVAPGWHINLPESIIDGYDRWYEIAIEVTDISKRYYIDGKFVYEFANPNATRVKEVFLQAYNFASDTWDPTASVSWDNRQDYTARFSDLAVYRTEGNATYGADADFSSLQAAIDAAYPGDTIVAQSDYVESININKAITVAGDQLEEGQYSLTGSGGYGAVRILSDDVVFANFDLYQGTSTGNIVYISDDRADIVIAGNTFNLTQNGIESQYGRKVDHIDIVGNTFIAGTEGIFRAVYINGAAAGVEFTAEDVHVYENTFTGLYGDGIALGIEGNGEVYYNDFQGADVNEGRNLVGFNAGNGVVDGNCFASTVTGRYVNGSNGAVVSATYNYFGGGAPDPESFGDGIVGVPYLLSCEDGVYIVAEQAPGGTISPDFVYTNASVPATFTITPNAGSVVQNVQIGQYNEDGELADLQSVGSVTSYTFPETAEGEPGITATFSANAAVITASVDGANGSLSPTGTFTLANGASKSFIATPAAGYSISIDYDGNGTVTQGAGGLITVSNITGTANELTVSFVPQGYDVTFSVTGQYAPIVNVTTPDSLEDVTASDEITFTVEVTNPNAIAAGVRVTTVRVNGVTQATNVLNGQTFTLTGVSQNTTVEFITGR